MKIKDVENRVGISAANIRYYEKEGLINPARDETNNYRDYSQRDVEQLERIKVLRVLGVPISDIRQLKDGAVSLGNVMEHRLELLKEEEKNLDAVRRVCESLRQCNLSYDAISESILAEDEECFSRQLARILKEDITKEILTPRQFNKNLALALSWGYFLSAVVSFFLGSWLLSYSGTVKEAGALMNILGIAEKTLPFAVAFENIFFVPLMLCIACYVLMYFTANVKILFFVFHLSALNLCPVIAFFYAFATTFFNINPTSQFENHSVSGLHLCLFCLMLAAYVILLYLLSAAWDRLFSKARYAVVTALIYTAVFTLLTGISDGPWLTALIGFFFFTLFIGLNWFHAYQSAKGNNRYYALTEGCRIMNIFGTMFDMKGKTIPPFVQR